MSQAFTEIITGGFGDVEGSLRTFISDTSSAILGDISLTKPIIDIGTFKTSGIGQTKKEVEETTKWSSELLQIEKDTIPVLQRQVTYYRQKAQEAVKLIPSAESEFQAAFKTETALKEWVEFYKDIGMETEATKITQNELVIATDRRVKAEQELAKLQADYKDYLSKNTASSKQLEETTRASASDWQKMGFGIKSAWDEFKKGAYDAEAIMKDLTNVILEGFSTAISDSMTAIFQPPTQEIEDAKAELDDLYKQREDIAKKMELIKVGGVLQDEAEEYQNLKKQLEDVNEQLRISKGNLDDLKSTAKRVGEAFRQFGKTILDALQQIIAKLIVVSMFESIGLGSWMSGLGLAKGGIAKGGFRKFATGGIAEGGFTSLDKTQKASWTPFLQNMMKAKFLQSGGVARGPMLGVIGEGSRNEAVVPLPDNKSIPVSFTNDKKTQAPPQDVKIVNLIDPKMVPSIMLQYPEAILNVISEDVLKRGPIYQLLRKV
jgi:cell division septum initiation protein DivIVA